MGPDQNFLTQVRSGQLIVAWVESGQPSLAWVCKISPKNLNFFNFFPSDRPLTYFSSGRGASLEIIQETLVHKNLIASIK